MGVSKYTVFAKTVELGSLTQAARALGCTQSAVSHAVSALEEETGLRLLRRSRGGLSLTPEGERLYPTVCRIRDGLEELARLSREARAPLGGVIRVASFTSAAVHWLPGAIKSFQAREPGARFELVSGDYHDVEEALRGGRADMGFVTLPSDLPDCDFRPLYRDPLLVVLPPDHPMAGRESFPLEAFAGESFISLLESSDQDARHALELAGVRPNIKFTTKDDYAIIAMVEQGLGVSIMPALLLQGRTEGVHVMPLENSAARTIGLAVTKSGGENSLAALFARHLQLWLGEKYGTAAPYGAPNGNTHGG